MLLLKPSVSIIGDLDGKEMLRRIELAGRTCYKSEDKIAEGSAETFVNMILKRGHETVIEHCSLAKAGYSGALPGKATSPLPNNQKEITCIDGY